MPTAIATIAERIVPHNELYCITAADIIEPAIDMMEQMIYPHLFKQLFELCHLI